MKIRIDRRWKKSTYTIGRLYLDGVFFCNTLEDKDRGLCQTDSLESIKERKVYGETAIPTGCYEVLMDVTSPKYADIAWYKNLCGGKMPRLKNVPGFEGILLHPGSSALDCMGCVLVGRNKVVGGLVQSKDTFKALYKRLETAYNKGEKIIVEIL